MNKNANEIKTTNKGSKLSKNLLRTNYNDITDFERYFEYSESNTILLSRIESVGFCKGIKL